MNQEIASLNSQLNSLDAGQAAVINAVQGAQQDLVDTQNQIATVQAQINAENVKLAPVTKNLFAVVTQVRKDEQELKPMLVTTYQASSAIISVLGDASLPNEGDISVAANSLAADKQDALSLQVQIDQAMAPISSAMASLNGLYQLEKAQQATYQAQADQLSGQAKDISSKISMDQYEIAALQAGDSGSGSNIGGWAVRGGIAPFGLGSRFDAFPWGQCTWYVASLRDVTWWGDAWMWAGNAAGQGYPEGLIPKVGAIVVWGPGHGYSGYGHVAYVAAVNGPSDFVVDEANYLGLGVVDQRHITTLSDVEAFIY